MVFIYSILLTLKKKKKTAKIAENYFLWVVGISGWKALDRGLQFFVKSLYFVTIMYYNQLVKQFICLC